MNSEPYPTAAEAEPLSRKPENVQASALNRVERRRLNEARDLGRQAGRPKPLIVVRIAVELSPILRTCHRSLYNQPLATDQLAAKPSGPAVEEGCWSVDCEPSRRDRSRGANAKLGGRDAAVLYHDHTQQV